MRLSYERVSSLKQAATDTRKRFGQTDGYSVPAPQIPDNDLPDGITYLSAGSYRQVYLDSQLDVVYKLDCTPTDFGNESEMASFEWLSKWSGLPEWAYVPTMEMVGGVLVAEYIAGPRPPECYWRECLCGWPDCHVHRINRLRELCEDANMWLSDMHPDNYRIVPDGLGDDYSICLIDLGHCEWYLD